MFLFKVKYLQPVVIITANKGSVTKPSDVVTTHSKHTNLCESGLIVNNIVEFKELI